MCVKVNRCEKCEQEENGKLLWNLISVILFTAKKMSRFKIRFSTIFSFIITVIDYDYDSSDYYQQLLFYFSERTFTTIVGMAFISRMAMDSIIRVNFSQNNIHQIQAWVTIASSLIQ